MPGIDIDDHQLTLPVDVQGPVVVRFDGRFIWSFTPERDGTRGESGWQVAWPGPLRTRLDGTATVRIEGHNDGEVHFEDSVTFRGNTATLHLVDSNGAPLAVDRAGHLARMFGATDQAARDEVVAGTARALRDLRDRVGVDAHLSYGALLGAVREGKMIDHDTDTDLAYLSRHTHPTDIIVESYRMERELRELGWRVVRMSGADLKLFLPLADGRSVHVDVFGAFHVGDTFYQLGGRSGRLPREALTPVSTVVLEGVELPAPADPERVLAFLYGPSWRVPDPAFQNVDPEEGVLRLDDWLRGTRTELVEWNELLRDQRETLPRTPSSFARHVAAGLPPGAEVVDLGAGNGRDTLHFSQSGHRVTAFDYAGAAVRQTRRRLARSGDPAPDVRVLPLNDLRAVLLAAAELTRTAQPPTLYARQLLGCLDEEARGNLWLLCATVLRRGGVLAAEFSAARPDRDADPDADAGTPGGLVRRFDADHLVAEITRSGGEVVSLDIAPGEDFWDRPDPAVARIEARWPAVPTTHAPEKENVAMNRPRTPRQLSAWLRELTRSVEENRRLNRRVAELTDIVAELLVPLADRDDERARELLESYRRTTLAP